jgi:hypothetical protein
MLAVGALAVGGAKLPWADFGIGTLGVGAEDCVSASVETPATRVADLGVTAETDGTVITLTSTDTGELHTLRYVQGEVTNIEGGGTSFLRQHEDGTYSFVMNDGTQVVFLMEAGIARIQSVAHPADGGDPNSSADCLSPTPRPSASWVSAPEPEPSWGGEIIAEPGVATSPFQCGFEFPAPVGSTGIITVGAPRWFSAGEAEAAIRSAFGDPESVKLAPSGADVPQVVYTSISTWPGGNYGGETGFTDPAEQQDLPTWTADGVVQIGGHVDGAQFVLEANDVVIATHSRDGSGAATQFLEPYDVGAGTLYGLDLTSGFDACPGVDPAILEGAQAVAVAGTKVVDSDGAEDGPYYAWHYITRA